MRIRIRYRTDKVDGVRRWKDMCLDLLACEHRRKSIKKQTGRVHFFNDSFEAFALVIIAIYYIFYNIVVVFFHLPLKTFAYYTLSWIVLFVV